MTTYTWQDRALAATRQSKTGAILRCALKADNDGIPRYEGKASVTSDGFMICDFVNREGQRHMGAFAGSMEDLENNVEGLAVHLGLNAEETEELRKVLTVDWVGMDYRSTSQRRG